MMKKRFYIGLCLLGLAALACARLTSLFGASDGAIKLSVPDAANVRSGPGTLYPRLGQVQPGEVIEATGKTESGDWLQIRYPDAPDGKAWIFAALTDYDQSNHSLPVIMDLPPTPTFAPEYSTGDKDINTNIAVWPDGKYFAVSSNHNVVIYSTDTLEVIRELEQNGKGASSVEWSPDGKKLAVGWHDRDWSVSQLVVYDAANWQKLIDIKLPNTWRILTLRWSPDGRYLAAGCDLRVFIFDVAQKKIIEDQTEFAASVKSVAWSPDGTRLIAGSDLAYGVRMWRLGEKRSAIRLFTRDASSAAAVDWSPDGKEIASAHSNGVFVLWDEYSKKPKHIIEAHTAALALAYSPDGKRLATGGGAVKIWDVKSLALLLEIPTRDNVLVERLAWLPDGDKILALYSDSQFELWDAAEGKLLGGGR
jgi:WD40 repeat protein